MESRLLIVLVTLCWASLAFQVFASVNESEMCVQALRDIYTSLNTPKELHGWKLDGGDPCRDSWLGVECFESTIIHLKLPGLGLNGTIGSQLVNLKDLKLLDLSSNIIEGAMPNSLPLNVTHLNLAGNRFTLSIPHSIDQMKHLRHLNLSHNTLSGTLGDVFSGLQNLREMDLSFNSFSGDLSTSFQSLTNLTRLFLQENQFTGTVNFLANLTLSDLNIEDNHFSGMIPEKLQAVHNLWIGGNRFDRNTNYPPWGFPFDNITAGENITSPPSTNISDLAHSQSEFHKQMRPLTTVIIVLGGLVLLVAVLLLAYWGLMQHNIVLQKRIQSEELHTGCIAVPPRWNLRIMNTFWGLDMARGSNWCVHFHVMEGGRIYHLAVVCMVLPSARITDGRFYICGIGLSDYLNDHHARIGQLFSLLAWYGNYEMSLLD